MAGHQLAEVQPELRLGEVPAFDRAAEFVGSAVGVLGVALDRKGQALDGERVGPVDVEQEAVALLGRAAVGDAAAIVDVRGEVGIQKREAGQVPRRAQPGQEFDDLGVRAAVDAGDDREVLDRSDGEVLLRDLAQAEIDVELAVDVVVVEAVVVRVFDEVREKEALAVRPAHDVLQGQDGRVFVAARERVFDQTILKLDFARPPLHERRRGRGRQQDEYRRHETVFHSSPP